MIVITSINPMNDAVRQFTKKGTVVLVADKKTDEASYTAESNNKNLIFLSTQKQETSFDCYAVNHYSRKNVGYMYAMTAGADIIYETDDDNYPNFTWQHITTLPSCVCELRSNVSDGFANVYRMFYNNDVWPRGLPLYTAHRPCHVASMKKMDIGIMQCLVDIDPDVDAVFRMLKSDDSPIVCHKNIPDVALSEYSWCPFNSQNTFWRKELFPLMYLPATCSPRYCDILRGYIAQAIVRHTKYVVGFSVSTAYQIRNDHNLMKDFTDEYEMHRTVPELCRRLGHEIHGSHQRAVDALKQAYRITLSMGITTVEEQRYLDYWCDYTQNFKFGNSLLEDL